MALPYKTPVNYRSAPVRVGTPEGITVAGGVALLAESPADPSAPAYPMVVVVGGTTYTRVPGTPAANQYRVRSQVVIGVNGLPITDYLPLLDFHASAEGLSGTVDYWTVGTRMTAEWVDALMWLLTPLVGITDRSTLETLYPASASNVAPGRPGRVAFLNDLTMWFSNGTSWQQIAGGGVPPSVWQALLQTLVTVGFSGAASFTAAWGKAETIAAALGFSSANAYLASGIAGAMSMARTMGFSSVSAFTAAWGSARAQAHTLGFSGVSGYTGPGGLSATRFYLHDTTTGVPAGTLPSGNPSRLGLSSPAVIMAGAATPRLANLTPGSSSVLASWTNVANNTVPWADVFCRRFVTPLLAAGSQVVVGSAGALSVGGAVSKGLGVGQNNYLYGMGCLRLYAWNPTTGAVTQELFNGILYNGTAYYVSEADPWMGSAGTVYAAAANPTLYAGNSVLGVDGGAGGTYTFGAGECIVIEVGHRWNFSWSSASDLRFWYDGATVPTANGTLTSNVASFVQFNSSSISFA